MDRAAGAPQEQGEQDSGSSPDTSYNRTDGREHNDS